MTLILYYNIIPGTRAPLPASLEAPLPSKIDISVSMACGNSCIKTISRLAVSWVTSWYFWFCTKVCRSQETRLEGCTARLEGCTARLEGCTARNLIFVNEFVINQYFRVYSWHCIPTKL